MYLQWGNSIHETTWLDDRLIEQSVFSRPEDADFPWIMSRLIPAPNYSWVAIETGAYERGGPIQLLNLRTGELLNLNRQVVPVSELEGITLWHESENWYVIGWHPDAQHLLLGLDGVGAVFWVDIQRQSYRRITLADSGGVSGKHLIDLAPDGSGFVYVTGFLDGNEEQRIDFYDLRNGNSTTLLTFPSREGNLYFPRFSPTGDSIAYVVEKRYPSTEQVLYVFDLKTRTNQTLFKGAMGLQEPIWSPDGRMIAFYKKDEEAHYVSIPSAGRLWFGNVWVVHVRSAETEQVTFVEGGVAYRPHWAQDGRTLAFITHNGEVGLVRVDDSRDMWQAATTSSDWPLFTSMFFLP
jgi:Tol biopolymer transport system component